MKSTKSMKLEPLRPSWDDLLLVCRACRKRSSGPADKSKDVASALRDANKQNKSRSRVVLTGCLGLCPNSATAIVVCRHGSSPEALALKSRA